MATFGHLVFFQLSNLFHYQWRYFLKILHMDSSQSLDASPWRDSGPSTNMAERHLSLNLWILLYLTLKVPRKSASENVVCICRLLHLRANFSNLHFVYRQTVWTLIRHVLWSLWSDFSKLVLECSPTDLVVQAWILFRSVNMYGCRQPSCSLCRISSLTRAGISLKVYTVKPALKATCIKQSPVFKGHYFRSH